MKFEIKEEYNLSPALIRQEREEWEHPFWTYMAFGDGRMSVHCALGSYHHIDDTVDVSFLAALSEGRADARTLPEVVQPTFKKDRRTIHPVGFKDAVVLINGLDQVTLLADFGLGAAKTIAVEGKVVLPNAPKQNERDADRIYVDGHLVCPDAIVAAMVGETAVAPTMLAFLKLSENPFTAQWQSWPDPSASFSKSESPKRGRWLRWQKAEARVAATPYTYAVNNGLVRNGCVYVSSCGPIRNSKIGDEHAAVSEIGSDGTPQHHVYFEDYMSLRRDESASDFRKFGKKTTFSSSGLYCALSGKFKSSDDWKGREKLLDLQTGELFDFSLPRGYATFRFVDHQGSDFWFALEDREAQVTRIICCQV